MLWRSHSPSGSMSLPLTLLLEVRQQEIVGKRLVIGQKIWYHTRVKSQAIYVHRNLYESENLQLYKSEVRGRVWSLSPFPRPSAIGVDPRGAPHSPPDCVQHLPVYRECVGRAASICWHVTS